ncbi:MAG: iron uptake porin [Cyanobacteria bacterium P01_A01_bin.17]
MSSATEIFSPPLVELENLKGDPSLANRPLTSVDQLTDVQPSSWAFQSLQSLIERYGVITGYPNDTFRGALALNRFEFASVLNTAIRQLSQRQLSRSDLDSLQKLQTKFASELSAIQGQVKTLEAQTADIDAHQFSTATKFVGQVIFAANAGGFTGDRIVAPSGVLISEDQPRPTFIQRTALFLNTSFNGTDQLQVRLISGSAGTTDNATGLLEPNLGSNLDYTTQGRDNLISLARLYYSFSPLQDLQLTIGPQLVISDYADTNSYANTPLDFSTQAFINNFVLFPRPAGAGAVLEWNPNQGPFHLRAMYVAGDAAGILPDNDGLIGGGGPDDIALFPAAGLGATGGLFGDPNQGLVELEYAPGPFAMRLQYSRGRVIGSEFDVLGLNAEVAVSDRIGLFGRYGYGAYDNTTLGDLRPNYWMAGVSVKDLLMPDALAGIAAGQPLIESAVGDGTQTNFEVFYNVPVSNNIRVTPLLQVVTNPGNQAANGTIFSSTVRVIFSF